MEVCKGKDRRKEERKEPAGVWQYLRVYHHCPEKLNMNYSSSGCMSVRTPRHQHSSKMMHKKYILDKLWRPHRKTEMSKLKNARTINLKKTTTICSRQKYQHRICSEAVLDPQKCPFKHLFVCF